MKHFFILLTLCLTAQTAWADDWKNYFIPDTLKTPEASELTQKQRRQLGNAALGTDYTLSKTKEKGDEFFEKYGFMASVDKYKRLEGLEQNAYVLSKMANAFRLNGEYQKAEYWFSQYINQTPHVEDYMHYAEVLQINGKCEDAVRWNKEYLTASLDTERKVLTDCADLTDIRNRENIYVENAAALNSESLDFSPTLYREGVLFTSNRGILTLTRKKDLWTKDNFTDLFYAEMNENGEVTEVEPLNLDINGKLHEGTAVFTADGKQMIFSRSDVTGESSEGVKELQLYVSALEDGKWTEGKKLSICKSEFAYTHPTLSADGRKLYFASNQKQGGYGGMDVWVSQLVDNQWKRPINLGPNVNTKDNEIFPYLGADNTLYFASNGHRGLGGLDIFTVKQDDPNNDRTWNARANLGKPFNSNKDDFAFVMKKTGDSGYFTSNRPGGKGEDDIYTWTGDLETVRLDAKLLVTDESNKQRLPGVEISVFDSETGTPVAITTNREGQTAIPLKPTEIYEFVIEQPGYLPYRTTQTATEMLARDITTLELSPITAVTTRGTVTDVYSKAPIPGARVSITDLCGNEIKEVRSDAEGNFTFTATCACDYRLLGEKENYSDGIAIYSSASGNCKTLTSEVSPVVVELKMEYVEPKIYEYSTAPKRLDGTLNKYFLGSDEMAFEKGQVIRLSNLYYDFDKYNIRPDAEIDLNYVYELLTTYKTMKIALLSHTDSRGTDRYNARLSQKRALSARDYLIARGINPNRLTSVGVGEGLPVNECTDGVECEEDQHQLNRRTEIKINALDEPGIRVIQD